MKNQIHIEEENMRQSTNQSPEETRNRAKSNVLKLILQLVAAATGAVLVICQRPSLVWQNTFNPLLVESKKYVSKAALSGGLKGGWTRFCVAAESRTVGDAFQEAKQKAVLGKFCHFGLSVKREKEEKDSETKGKSGTN
ncbi:hypothetical protein ATANTOWER_024706 [Ataeniobius toweri]|uniref:Uncharacterized protein n=1 Tax=Ataeniobius toweri TaxID=208326 RepID=A0ABU7C0W4_9TELE|nr:hypothetical protein [Ataeniobius toweri]